MEIKSIYKVIEEMGWRLMAFTNLSSHPDDWYLEKVLCTRDTSNGPEYVTWIYNRHFQGCNNGHYFWNLENAREDYKNRK